MCVQAFQEPALAARHPDDAALPEMRTSPLNACLNAVAAWIARSAQRKALRELAQEGRLLSDIGITRGLALSAATKSFWR
jgi:uncharacterized protein YjiS (DUF1127 family)